MTPTRTSARIVGLDVARGLAVIGMIAAHVGDDGTRGADSEGWPWLVVVHGHSSALFAVLMGVTIAIMVAGAGGRDDALAVRRTRVKVAVRAALLIVIGLVLTQLSTGVDIVLVNLGLIMLLAIPAFRAPTWALLVGALAAFTLGQVVADWIADQAWSQGLPVLGRLWSYHYPALSWIGYALVGLAVGRAALRETRIQLALLGGGAAVTGATLLIRVIAGDGPFTGLGAHSYTPLELVSNTAVAATVIGAACWLTPRVSPALAPVQAVGAMALTAYVLHLLIIAGVGDEMVYEPSNLALIVLELVVIATCWAWRHWLGQGPLERVLSRASNAVASATVRDVAAGSVSR